MRLVSMKDIYIHSMPVLQVLKRRLAMEFTERDKNIPERANEHWTQGFTKLTLVLRSTTLSALTLEQIVGKSSLCHSFPVVQINTIIKCLFGCCSAVLCESYTILRRI